MNSTTPPQVSVIIPAFNSGRYLTAAIESVFRQEGVTYELIVVDDGSTDETEWVLAGYEGRLRSIKQVNGGVSQARNRGLQLAQGEWIAFLDADDWFLPDKLARQTAVLAERAELGGLHSGWQLVDEGGRPLRELQPWLDAPHLDLADWLMWKPAFLGGLLLSREWLERVGGFDESLPQAEDVDLLWRLSMAGCRFAWLQELTVCYRRHGENTVGNGRVQAESMCRVMDKFFAQPDLPTVARKLENRVRYYTLLWLVWQLFRTGYQAEIPAYLRQSLNYTDFSPETRVAHWLGQLVRFAEQDKAVAELRPMWPFLREAMDMDDGRWAEIAPGLDWWLDVWRLYLAGQTAAAETNLANYAHLSPRRLIEMAQSGVLVSPRLAETAVIGQFWTAAQRMGLVSPAKIAEVTGLYLTTMAHALFQHRWGLAVRALAHALRYSGQRRGLAAWRRFFTAAWGYYGGRP